MSPQFSELDVRNDLASAAPTSVLGVLVEERFGASGLEHFGFALSSCFQRVARVLYRGLESLGVVVIRIIISITYITPPRLLHAESWSEPNSITPGILLYARV
jgi:hypothetical protein